ncbi:MAG: CHAT domain-containing tetratricopeptide repeat protein [Kofleriaceae bacterium]
MVWFALAALAAGACRRVTDERCSKDLRDKRDAIDSCSLAYDAAANTENARRLVEAYAAQGEDKLLELHAHNPWGPVAAEIAHHRAELATDPARAIEGFEMALALRGDDPSGKIRELEGLAERYEMMGDTRRGLAFEAQAFQVATTLGDPIVLAHTRVTLATNLTVMGDDEAGFRVLGDATSRLPDADIYLPIALILEGEYLRTHQRPQLARQAYKRCEAIANGKAKQTAHRNLIDVALATGDVAEARQLIATDDEPRGLSYEWYASRVALAMGDTREALQRVDRALASKPTDSFKPVLLTLRGRALASLGRNSEAIDDLTTAIELLDAQVDSLEIDELKAFAQRDPDYRAPYEYLFALHARTGRFDDAFAIAQRATGRAYLDGLTDPTRSVPEDPMQVVRAADAHADAMQLIAKSLRTSLPTRPLTPRELVTRLRAMVVWQFFAADDHLWLIDADRGSITVDDLGSMEALKPSIDAAITLSEPALEELGAKLVPASRWASVSPSDVVHLAPGPLERVPFAALRRDSKRWIESAAIAYVPSAAVLAELLRQRSKSASFVVVGDARSDLNNARAEATETAARLSTRAFLGDDATVAAVMNSGNARVLAIATHAEVTTSGARLILADGVVTPADIIDHKVSPSLAVIASCKSAAVGVDAWGALAGAFLATGTPNIIASRWDLNDAQSRTLIRRFYEANGLERPALALAEAQRDAIAHASPPRDWGALIAIGSGTSNERMTGE